MTRKDKERVIAVLEEYKGDSTGLIAATVEDCQKVVREMPAEDGWIPVSVRLPERFKKVILCREGNIVEQGYRDVNDWWKVYGTRTKKITHWMPLPEPPGEDS